MTNVPAAEVSPLTTSLPEPGIYEHFKGARYELLCVAKHSESEEFLALYCSLDAPDKLWARPVEMFSEVVQVSDGLVPRFAFQAPLGEIEDETAVIRKWSAANIRPKMAAPRRSEHGLRNRPRLRRSGRVLADAVRSRDGIREIVSGLRDGVLAAVAHRTHDEVA